jgi:hypothetical protein
MMMLNTLEVWSAISQEAINISDDEDILIDNEAHDIEQTILSLIQYN